MATPEENLIRFQEIARRGLQDELAPEIRARFDEAVSRGLVTLPGPRTIEPIIEAPAPVSDDVPVLPGQGLPPGAVVAATGSIDRSGVTPSDVPTELPGDPGAQPRGPRRSQFLDRPLGQQIRGTGEMLLTLATAAPVQTAAGIAGITNVVDAFIRGEEDPLAQGAETVERIVSQRSFRPGTEAGRESLQAVSAPLEALQERVVLPAARAVGDVTGSPALATATQTVAETFPIGLALLKPGNLRDQIQRRREGLDEVARVEETTGVDIGARPQQMGEQIVAGIDVETGGQRVRAQDLELVQNEIVNARQVAKDATDALFEQARETNAAVATQELIKFKDVAEAALATFDTAGRPQLAGRLRDLEAIDRLPPNSAVKLEQLTQFRERINRSFGNDPGENRGLAILKSELDSFLDSQLQADLIRGDAAALQKWKDATAAFADYRRRFTDDRAIRTIAEQELTPEQVKSLIFNQSVLGAKKESGAIVDRIADLVGRDSPAFAALRQEAIFDLVEPLMSETPNIQRFIRDYDRFIRNNDTLVEALFPLNQPFLQDLRNLVGSTREVRRPNFQINLVNSLARAGFGHEISQGALKVGIAEQVMNLLVSGVTPSARRQITGNLLGFDPSASVLGVAPIAGIGATEALLNEQLTESGLQLESAAQ